MSTSAFLPVLASGVAAAAGSRILANLAPSLGLVDEPGGRKDQGRPVPVVGGIALVIALLVGGLLVGDSVLPPYFVAAAGVLVVVSVRDDWHALHYIPRFGSQIVAVLVMVFGSGVQLASVGDLLGWRPIGLWLLSVPITVFAVVGLINAMNLIDGMDGLAGSLALVAFAWYGYVASLLGDAGLASLAWVLCGGLAGFLLFNLRFPWQPAARVYLGDAGSTLLGFALGWFAIALSQREGARLPPIAALWVVLLPLADTVSLMARRISRGQSPFQPDREHIHHFLLAQGLSVNAALVVLVGASACLGAVGVLGWRAGVPEPVLFWTFFLLFFAYHFAITAGWRRHHARNTRWSSRGPRPARWSAATPARSWPGRCRAGAASGRPRAGAGIRSATSSRSAAITFSRQLQDGEFAGVAQVHRPGEIRRASSSGGRGPSIRSST